jgi:hypothetical protein
MSFLSKKRVSKVQGVEHFFVFLGDLTVIKNTIVSASKKKEQKFSKTFVYFCHTKQLF